MIIDVDTLRHRVAVIIEAGREIPEGRKSRDMYRNKGYQVEVVHTEWTREQTVTSTRPGTQERQEAIAEITG